MVRALTILVVFATTGLAQDELKPFAPKGEGFQVAMPGDPKLIEQDVMGLKLKMWIYEKGDGGYAVAITDIGKFPEEEIEMRLDGARDGAVKNVGGKLIKETKVMLDKKYPGRQIDVSLPQGDAMIRQRFYIADGRLYQVMSIGKKDWVETKESAAMLDSLKIVPK
jgi:hypothetical protein